MNAQTEIASFADGSGNLTTAAHRLDRAKTEHHRCVWGELA